MKKLNKKGFTLIELLAVIVILGILMLIAIPAVTKYIASSRKDTFENTAMLLVDAVRNEVASKQPGTCYADIDSIPLEKGDKSQLKGYIYATQSATDGTYTYTVDMVHVENKLILNNKAEKDIDGAATTSASAVTKPAVDTAYTKNCY